MNIFFWPFDRGGSEQSSRDLAYLLIKRGHQVTIVTPNYGAENKEEVIDGIKIHRMPFPKKVKDPKEPITPWWTNNLLWFIFSSLYCTYYILKEKADVIHVQNNEFIPAAVFMSFLLKKPTIVTFRDYQILCPHGFCLWNKKRACTLKEYIKKDLNFFFNNYVQSKNVISYILLLIVSLRARAMQKILYYFAQKISYKVAVSKKLSEIFKANGVGGLKVINNPVIIKKKIAKKTNNEIVYVGRLSKGKGVDFLLETIPQILKRLPSAKFVFIGSGYLEPQLKRFVKKRHLEHQVKFIGYLDHNKVLEKIKKSALVVVPSFWQEPLSRSLLEAILSATPVVASKKGGMTDVLKEEVYGVLFSLQQKKLEEAIIAVFLKKDQFRKNLIRDLNKNRKMFSDDVVASYQKIYQKAQNL